jgi:hypothetical protein
MSFREKSAWICTVAIVLVYGFCGWAVLHGPLTKIGAVLLLIVSSVLMTVITAVGHIAVAIGRRMERPDERDNLIAMRSGRYGYYTLAFGVWGLFYLALASPEPAILAYAALGVFVLAELARFASQLVMYRLGG